MLALSRQVRRTGHRVIKSNIPTNTIFFFIIWSIWAILTYLDIFSRAVERCTYQRSEGTLHGPLLTTAHWWSSQFNVMYGETSHCAWISKFLISPLKLFVPFGIFQRGIVCSSESSVDGHVAVLCKVFSSPEVCGEFVRKWKEPAGYEPENFCGIGACEFSRHVLLSCLHFEVFRARSLGGGWNNAISISHNAVQKGVIFSLLFLFLGWNEYISAFIHDRLWHGKNGGTSETQASSSSMTIPSAKCMQMGTLLPLITKFVVRLSSHSGRTCMQSSCSQKLENLANAFQNNYWQPAIPWG